MEKKQNPRCEVYGRQLQTHKKAQRKKEKIPAITT